MIVRQINRIDYFIRTSEARLRDVKLGQRLASALHKQENLSRNLSEASLNNSKIHDKERPKSMHRLHKIRPEISKKLLDESYTKSKYQILGKEINKLRNLSPLIMVRHT